MVLKLKCYYLALHLMLISAVILNFQLTILKYLLLSQVRNLGVIFDAQLAFNSLIKNITKVVFFHLHNIARIRPFLSRPDAERLIHAFITSWLDYCISLFGGLPASSVKRLQYIQNSAVQVLTYTSARHHITSVLQQLHWLPVQ